MRQHLLGTWAVLTLAACWGCAHNGETAKNGAPPRRTVKIAPGENAQEQALTALIEAQTGDIIEFAEGKYEFDTTLALEMEENLHDITIKGAGMDKTILNFSKTQAGVGGEGIRVSGGQPTKEELDAAAKEGKPAPTPADPNKRDNIVIAELTVQDSRSDGIKVEGARGVIFRNVKAEWTRGPNEDNGAYGVYPVICDDVLVEGCVSIAASDAGIYVGQSSNIMVRGCTAKSNVAGIEIENSIGADVTNNTAEGNTGGILVFALPGLPRKVGKQCRVFNNHIIENNIDNFAKAGNIVATVPPGTGLLIMANDDVEVFNNEFKNNNSFNISVISFLTTRRTVEDAGYDPYSEGISIHDNQFEGGGAKPGGEFATMVSAIMQPPLPDILYDGVVNPAKKVDGNLPEALSIRIQNNKDATFANMNLGPFLTNEGLPNVSDDAAPFTGELPALPGVDEKWSEGIN